MKTQVGQSVKFPTIKDFQQSRIRGEQLILIKGGDGETPPEDGIIGVEDIAGM